jgi:hypothetical protein
MSNLYNQSPHDGNDEISIKVHFMWIVEAWRLFEEQATIWIFATLAGGLLPLAAIAAFMAVILPSSPLHVHHGFETTHLLSGRTVDVSDPNMVTIAAFEFFIFVASAFFMCGMLRMAFLQVRGELITVRDVFNDWRTMGRMIGYMLLTSIIIMAAVAPVLLLMLLGSHRAHGFGLKELAGAIIGTAIELAVFGLVFPGYAAIADGFGVLQSFSLSFRSVYRNMWRMLGLVFILYLIVEVSFIPCGLGLLVTLPLLSLVCALAYHDLVGMAHSSGA